MVQVASIVGNGPSRKSFDGFGDYVVGCNFPGMDVHATFITDIEVIKALAARPELVLCDLIVSRKAYDACQRHNISNTILDTYKHKPWYTTAHYAAEYLTKIKKYDIIHIWGCDSYFEDNAESVTDLVVPKTGDIFFKKWRRAWNTIFEDNPATTFIMHKSD